MESKIQDKIDKFFSKYKSKVYKKGETLILPEEPLVYIFNLKKGFVKSYSLNEGGFELTINIYKPYSFFPITETLAGRTNTYFFEAITDVIVQKAPTHEVHEFVKENSDVLFDLTKRISSGLEGFMVRTQYLIRSNSSQKVASSLVLLARRFGENTDEGKIKIAIPQTHEDIANLAGVSRETASIELKKLRDIKVISEKAKKYTVNDYDKLQELSTIYHEDKPLPFRF
ncbi:Crp/Fnr family transcriptional regulator [Candidatus Woesebacteria bacterium]|nr:Crp/Fnr family transcriptional regulator [Candidatus Woesebacteria bacterium]